MVLLLPLNGGAHRPSRDLDFLSLPEIARRKWSNNACTHRHKQTMKRTLFPTPWYTLRHAHKKNTKKIWINHFHECINTWNDLHFWANSAEWIHLHRRMPKTSNRLSTFTSASSPLMEKPFSSKATPTTQVHGNKRIGKHKNGSYNLG